MKLSVEVGKEANGFDFGYAFKFQDQHQERSSGNSGKEGRNLPRLQWLILITFTRQLTN